MTEFVFITASDIHISDNGPRSRVDDFRSTILGKISQIRMACNKLGADGVILAGDLYNLKNPARNSHRLNQDLIKEFQKFACPIYMIERKHDLTANRLESLEEQPLGVLFADKTLRQLRHEIIEKDGNKISLVGIPYSDTVDIKKLKIPDKGDCFYQICAMHIYAGSKAGMLYKERLYSYEELSVLSPDVFIIGHYHIYQGIENVSGKYFVNLGSITRGTQSDEDIAHQPQIGFIKVSTDNGEVSCTARSIKLKIKPASEVFDLTKREEEQKENQEIQKFVEKLSAEAVNQSKMANKTIEEIIDSMDMAKAVKDKVMYFIQEAAA